MPALKSAFLGLHVCIYGRQMATGIFSTAVSASGPSGGCMGSMFDVDARYDLMVQY